MKIRHSELKIRSLKIFIAIFVMMMLSSCSSDKGKKELSPDEGETETVQEMTVEAEPREPIYIYRKKQEQNLKELTLTMNSQPLLLPSGYVRLVGVVSGGKPMALVEVGGRGLGVGIGEEVGGYRVVAIVNGEVSLKK